MNDPDLASVSSLDKALALFRAIVGAGGATPSSVLAADVGLPPSTARRLLLSLNRAGIIARIGHGRYDVAPALLAQLRPRSLEAQLVRCAQPLLRRLAQRLGATIHIGILENDMVTYVLKAVPRTVPADALFTSEGGQLEAYCSGIGKVLLAALPDCERERYLSEGPFIALTERTIISPDALRDHLKDVVANGFAIDDGEILDSLRCFAAPLTTAEGLVVAAMSISVGLGHRLAGDLNDGVEEITRAARAVSDVAFPVRLRRLKGI